MPRLGLVGPMSSAASHQSIPDHKSKNNQTAINKLPNGITEEDMNKYCEEWSAEMPQPLVPLVHGFCLGVTRQLINTIGLFDEDNFPRGYGEENDYCFRAMDAGFGAIIATDTYIFHEKSKSYTDSEKRIALMKRGSDKLRELHGDERVQRAIKTMQNNPALITMREKAAELYDKYEK
jgi:GT2 family glycosyltransferase